MNQQTGTTQSSVLGLRDPHEDFKRKAVADAMRQAERNSDQSADASESEAPEAAEVARLAALDPMAYDRERQAAADRLGIRVATLDAEVRRIQGQSADDQQSGIAFDLTDPEPWPTPVDGAALLDELVRIINTYVALPKFATEAVALLMINAHAHENFFISPILAITSPVLGCGKTTLISLLSALTPRPLPASNVTTASLFRAIEKWQPTLLIDEADTYLRGNEELRGVLDSGHNRAGAWILRCVGEDHEPRKFSTWCGKAIALIGKLPATLESRSIHVEMRRLRPDETVEQLRPDRLAHLEPLRRKAWRWARDHDEALRDGDPEMPPSLRGRAADNWRPLFAIAALAGGDWPKKARQAAEALEAGDDAEGLGIQLLRDLRDLFAERDTDRLASGDIVKALAQMEDRPWPEYKRGKPITQRQLATLLKGFGAEPRTLRLDDTARKGYDLADFQDAFARYTPPQSVTALQSPIYGASGDSPSVTQDGDVTDRRCEKPNNHAVCNAVTDRTPPTPGRKEVVDL